MDKVEQGKERTFRCSFPFSLYTIFLAFFGTYRQPSRVTLQNLSGGLSLL
jgi:hypothetical protein